jgi:outer membrane protein OmpA-like peptidoglycan-associated protein
MEKEMKRKLTVYSVILAALLLSACKTVPPTMDLAEEEIYYISPKNGDGVQDALSVPVDLKPDKRMVIFGYKITTSDSSGEIIRTVQDEAVRPGFWKSLGKKKTGVEIPEFVFWDGRTDTNAFAEDGEYSVLFEAWDDRNRSVTSSPIRVVVDNTSPVLELSIPYKIFSPNGDGNKDTLPITAVSSSEDTWSGSIYDTAGKTVASFQWAGSHPENIRWDGKNDRKEQLPDGMYSYRAFSVDRAGNGGVAELSDIGINTQPTTVSLALDRTYFSPNGDGINDTVTFSPLYQTEGVEGWMLEIMDKASNRVLRLQGTEWDPIIWDGGDDDGITVLDGTYTAEFSVLYEDGDNPMVAAGPITVDTVRPALTLVPEYTLFSPDGDGFRDVVRLAHMDSSSETGWTGEIKNSRGAAVRQFSWEARPSDVVWDGTDKSGRMVGDGVYSYVISSTDEAGNSLTSEITGIRIDTRKTPLVVSVSAAAFSPNRDGVLDSITFTPEPGLNEGILNWEVRILDNRNTVVKREKLTRTGPYIWNGLTDGGRTASDGEYRAEIELFYEKGNRPLVKTAPFTIDTVYPSAQITTDYMLFSPNGDGRLDTVTFKVRNATREESWKGEVLSAPNGPTSLSTARQEQVLRTQTWQGPPRDFVWDGKDDRGRVLPDGYYLYRLVSTDKAGNKGVSELRGIELDTRPTPIGIRLSDYAFSPNNDRKKDTVTIYPEIAVTEGLTGWFIRVLDSSQRPIWEHRGGGTVAAQVWDGKTSAGRTTSDGNYFVQLEARYASGANPKQNSSVLTVDTVAPTVSIEPVTSVFSPNGDGRIDTMRIAQTTSREDSWTGQIFNDADTVIRVYTWTGNAGELVWDGKDGSGVFAPDGIYRYSLSSEDRAGNSISAEVKNLRLDTRRTPIRIAGKSSGFSPNGDGVHDTMMFDTYLGVRDGIKSWEVAVVNEQTSGTVSVGAGTGTNIPAEVLWNGKSGRGTLSAEGAYYAVFTVEYANGNLSRERSATFLLDITPPQAVLSIQPLPFSPDADGENDTVTITPSARDASPIERWNAAILDPVGNLFIDFTGTGAPGKPIVWNGKSPKGELVQAASDYTVRFTAVDIFGNRTSIDKILPVDVYVIREGDRLRIQISSIYFAPFTADFQPGKEGENRRTLDRLAEILKKYDQYRIVVEGHAVRIYWFSEPEGKAEETNILGPLSRERAEVVKRELAARGIRETRMSTAGFGGNRPVVPHSDLDNRWKNRRVEFILRK